MDIKLPGHTSPTAGFDEPLALLSACHARIAKQCAILQRLPGHLAVHGADADARQAAARVLHYFDTAGYFHHQDEEQDLFPALFEPLAGSDAVCLRGMEERIAREHRELDSAWQTVRAPLVALTSGDACVLDAHAATTFQERHQRHINFEEIVFRRDENSRPQKHGARIESAAAFKERNPDGGVNPIRRQAGPACHAPQLRPP